MRHNWHFVAVFALIVVGVDVMLFGLAKQWKESMNEPGEAGDRMPIVPGEDLEPYYRLDDGIGEEDTLDDAGMALGGSRDWDRRKTENL